MHHYCSVLFAHFKYTLKIILVNNIHKKLMILSISFLNLSSYTTVYDLCQHKELNVRHWRVLKYKFNNNWHYSLYFVLLFQHYSQFFEHPKLYWHIGLTTMHYAHNHVYLCTPIHPRTLMYCYVFRHIMYALHMSVNMCAWVHTSVNMTIHVYTWVYVCVHTWV